MILFTSGYARMIFTALEFTEQIPFKDVLMHGLVRDADGQKMSKSLGNGVDPLEVIEQYGADAMRLYDFNEQHAWSRFAFPLGEG